MHEGETRMDEDELLTLTGDATEDEAAGDWSGADDEGEGATDAVSD